MASRRPCRLFIFDLDGTLIDSRADLVCSVNRTLARLGYAPLSGASIDGFVGEGVNRLIERVLTTVTGHKPESETIAATVKLYLEDYSRHLLDDTRLRDQAKEALDALSGAAFAVVTNKNTDFSRRILEGLGVGDRFSIILGADAVRERKPAPEALFKAMEFCGATPEETVMIGDGLVDIQAGKAAGTATCGILGGFRPDEELINSGCDVLITALPQLADHFIPIRATGIPE